MPMAVAHPRTELTTEGQVSDVVDTCCTKIMVLLSQSPVLTCLCSAIWPSAEKLEPCHFPSTVWRRAEISHCSFCRSPHGALRALWCCNEVALHAKMDWKTALRLANESSAISYHSPGNVAGVGPCRCNDQGPETFRPR